jgi:hypothetical protein
VSACGGAIENTAFAHSGAGLKTAFFRVPCTGKVLKARWRSKGRSKAAHTALVGLHSAGFCCQAMIADSRHPTRPGEMRTGLGNCPLFIIRQRVVRESEVASSTSLSRMKRSSLLTLGSYNLSLCEILRWTGC